MMGGEPTEMQWLAHEYVWGLQFSLCKEYQKKNIVDLGVCFSVQNVYKPPSPPYGNNQTKNAMSGNNRATPNYMSTSIR